MGGAKVQIKGTINLKKYIPMDFGQKKAQGGSVQIRLTDQL